MDRYVRMFDDLKRDADDNPTLGIILRADKDDTLVHAIGKATASG